jgi:hypothetical protein
MMAYVSSGRRPVSRVNTRTEEEIRDAMSTIAMPSFWKEVAMAKESPKVSMAQARMSEAGLGSKSGKLNNLYRV